MSKGNAYRDENTSVKRPQAPRTGIGTKDTIHSVPSPQSRTGIGDEEPNGEYNHLGRKIDRDIANGGIEFFGGSNFKISSNRIKI